MDVLRTQKIVNSSVYYQHCWQDIHIPSQGDQFQLHCKASDLHSLTHIRRASVCSTFRLEIEGRLVSSTEVLLLRFWKAKNFKRNGELMGVYMIFIDYKSTLMPFTTNVNRLTTV